MSRRIIILYVVVSLSYPVFGQGSAERLAHQNIRKGKWEKAYAHLHHKGARDSVNVSNAYVQALYFFAPSNPDFQLDSAYQYTQLAFTGYLRSTTKQRDRLNRFPLDSTILINLREDIDSAAFVRARELNTENAYLEFGVKFPQAAQQQEARLLRDEAAYNDARNINTHEAYYSFLTRYPSAAQAAEARKYYERLLFLEKTADKRLSSYQQFIRDYPHTAYQREAEKHIFEIATAAGTIDSYKIFLRSYSTSHYANRARNILFHLIPEDQLPDQFPYSLFSDSLRSVLMLSHDYLVPFLHNGRFGFMNHQGTVVIGEDDVDIGPDYRCGNIGNDVLVLPTKIVALNGASILNEAVGSVDDLGFGYLLLEGDSCMRVLHKSGFALGDRCIDDARILNGKLLALKKAGQWSLWTLTGRMLMPYIWDDITSIKDVIVLKDDGRYTLQTAVTLARRADLHDDGKQVTVDEVKTWRNDFVWVRQGNDEGVLDQSLNILINIEKHVLSSAYFGSTAIASAGTQTFNDAGKRSMYYLRIVSKEPWTAVKSPLGWQLFDPKTETIQSPLYDSITFTGPFAMGQKKDSLRVYFSPRIFLTIKQPATAEFVSGRDSTSFLLLEQGKKKTLYDTNGKKLFTLLHDRIQDAGDGFFIVNQKDKKGMIGADGKMLLPVEFDAIGTLNKGVASLLQGTRFGLFDAVRKKLIKPQYTKNLTAYNDRVVIAYKDNVCGFLGWDNKPVGKVEFNEIRYWNDTTALVKKDMQWMLYEIKTGTILLDGIKDFSFIRDKHDEKLAIFHKDHHYGVAHSKKGTIIPPNFSDIINVGSKEEPLYFTEKHVEEAGIFVVIYYDAKGNLLRKEVYEQEEYEKIYCSDN